MFKKVFLEYLILNGKLEFLSIFPGSFKNHQNFELYSSFEGHRDKTSGVGRGAELCPSHLVVKIEQTCIVYGTFAETHAMSLEQVQTSLRLRNVLGGSNSLLAPHRRQQCILTFIFMVCISLFSKVAHKL